MTDCVLSEHAAEGVERIVMNRPGVLNALNEDLVSELTAAVLEAAWDGDVRVIVLTGAGRAFCSGADRRRWAERAASNGERAAWLDMLQRLSAAIWSAPKPVIAAVNGHAVGGGFELALACDLIVASRDTQFSLPEVRLGTSVTGGLTYTLPAQIGLARSKALVYMSDMLTATQAHELGIVWKVTEGRADDAALEAARILAGRDPAALVAAKQGLQDAGADAMAHALQREWRLAAAGTAPDAPMACKDRGGRT